MNNEEYFCVMTGVPGADIRSYASQVPIAPQSCQEKPTLTVSNYEQLFENIRKEKERPR
jgi:hypothetical protein